MKLITIGKRFAAVTLLALGLSASGAENLLPKFVEVTEGQGGWVRNRASLEADFTIDAEAKTLSIATHGEKGYADWRAFGKFAPGDYTIAAQFTGATGSLCVNIYSFDEAGKPTLLVNRTVPSPANNTRLVHSFTVPANSVKLRIGFTIYKNSEWKIINPILVSGKTANPSL